MRALVSASKPDTMNMKAIPEPGPLQPVASGDKPAIEIV